jgi:SWI/SNF-related matrix-associated actin-dependent regulator of chromatin subfamily A3
MDEYLPRSNSCPLCRHNINPYSLLELPPDTSEYVEPEEVTPVKSAKIEEIIKYLKVFDKNDKSLVFSQFTSFLDLVAAGLKAEGIKFCRFDGSMSSKKVSPMVPVYDLLREVKTKSWEADEVETRSYRSVPNSNNR